MSTENTDDQTPDAESPVPVTVSAAASVKPEEPATELKPKARPRGRPRKTAPPKESPEGIDLFSAQTVQPGHFPAGLAEISGAVQPECLPVLSAETGRETEQSPSAESRQQDTELLQAPAENFPAIWYMLTNRSNMLTIMGCGAVTTAADAWRYVEDSRQACNGLIPIWSGGVPPELVQFTQGKGVSAPVLLEFMPEIEALLPPGEEGVRLCSVPIPFSKVRKVFFKDQASLEDFELKQFDDLPVLTAGLLQHGFPEMHASELPLPAAPTRPGFAFSAFDRQLGALLSATDALAGRAVAQELLCNLLNFLLERIPQTAVAQELPGAISRANLAVSDSMSDRWLLHSTLAYLDDAGYDVGFNQYDFLNTLEAAAKSAVSKVQGLSAADEKEISDWCGHCRHLLDGTREIWALTDTQHTFVKRGVLLFILRPEQERFRKVIASTIKPGPRVYLIAAFLLGYMSGVTRLESPTKKNGRIYFSLIEHFLKIAASPAGSEKSTVSVSTEKPASDVLRVVIAHDGLELGHWDVRLLPSIFRTYTIAREAGLQASIDFYANRLTVISAPEKFDLHVRAVGSGESGDRIRIYFDLKQSEVKRQAELAPVLKSMLSFNGLDSSLGKFAVSEDGGSFLYAVDCSVSALSVQGIRLVVSHVAHVASTCMQNIFHSR